MQKKPIKALGEWFYYTLSERRAAFYLCIIIIVLSLLPFTYDRFLRPKPKLVIQEHLIDQLEKESPAKNQLLSSTKQKVAQKHINKVNWYDLIQIGIPKKTANAILNYRKALKGFKSVNQLNKVYGITSSDVNNLQKHFVIPFEKPKTNHSWSIQEEEFDNNVISIPEGAPININHADSTALLSLKGIGPFFTSKILRFRRALGGFHSVEQLNEVYGIPDSILRLIQDKVYCEGDYVRINVNEADVTSLAKSPYITYKKAQLLTAYRLQHGYFEQIEQVKQAGLFGPEEIEKLEPYIRF